MNPNAKWSKPIIYLWLVVSILHVGIAIFDLKRPMDWDELDAAARLASPESYVENKLSPYGNVDVINPYRSTRNHALANLTAKISFMTLGVSEITARIPAIVYTVLFCLATLLVIRSASPMVAGIVLLHSVANGTIMWFSHSMRGYISLMLFSLLMAATFLLAIQGKSNRTKSWSLPIGFALSSLLLVVSHSFGILFFFFFSASILVWGAINRTSSPMEVKRARPFLLISLLVAPLPLSIVAVQYHYLNQIGLLQSKVAPSFLSSLCYGLGMKSSLVPLLILAAIVLMALLGSKRKSLTRIGFLSVFNVLALASLSALFFTLKPDYFDGRFLLAFVVPFVWWCAQSVERLWGANSAIAGLLLLAGFVALPLLGTHYVYHHQTEQMLGFHEFSEGVKTQLQGISSYCMSASGDEDQSRFSRDIYFYDAFRATSCSRRYLLHFSRNWKGMLPLQIPGDFAANQIFGDREGRALFELIPHKPMLKMG